MNPILAYALGVASPLVAFIVLDLALSWVRQWRSWRTGNFGRGHFHDFDHLMDNGEWYPRSRHTHYWPAFTPWWFIALMEPLRVRHCLKDPSRRPATSNN